MPVAECVEAMEAFGLVDRVEEGLLASYPEVTFPLTHNFTPGLYTRTIYIPAGSFLTSKIHNTEHPFVIVTGSISVWTKETGAVTLHAPFHGVTKPGTQRILFAHTDTCWMTFHPTDETDLAVIEDQIIMKHTNPLLEGGQP